MNKKNIKTPEDAKVLILKYIDNRLHEWANWFKKGSRAGIGYPPHSIEYRLMTEGHVIKEYLGIKPLPTHADAEEIESLMVEMMAQNRKMAEVIKNYYFEVGGIRCHAKKLKMGHAQFENHLHSARWWLAGRLSTKPEIKQLMAYITQVQALNHRKI